MTRLGTMLAAAVLCLAGGQGLAKDIFVNDGAGEGDGTKAAPFPTIWQAMQVAESRDVIHVAAGEYNGRDGFASFQVQSPHLTLVGGYSEDFSSRDPFKHLTIVRSKGKHTAQQGHFTHKYTPGKIESARGFTIDGFLIDGSPDNSNQEQGLVPQGSRGSSMIHLRDTNDPWRTANVKVRNCLFINSNLEPMVSVTWAGAESEITNCLFVGMMHSGIDLSNAAAPRTSPRGFSLDAPVVTISNCTMAFGFFHKRMNGSYAINVGSNGRFSIKDSVFAYVERDGGAENGTAINSQRGAEDLAVEGNVFWQVWRPAPFIDAEGRSQLAPAKSDDWEDDWGDDAAAAEPASGAPTGTVAAGNTIADPGLEPDAVYFDKVSYRALAQFVDNGTQFFSNTDELVEKRRALGLREVVKGELGIKSYAPVYPESKVVPNLASKIPGKGIQLSGPFETYASAPEAERERVQWQAMEGAQLVGFTPDTSGAPVQFTASVSALSTRPYRFPEQEGTAEEFAQVELWIDGKQSEKIDVYIKEGSRAAGVFNEAGKGLVDVRGRAYYDSTGATKAKAVVVVEMMRERG